MKYISTRGAGPTSARRALLAGLAPDGGLWVPETVAMIPTGVADAAATRPYMDTAADVLAPYMEPAIGRYDLGRLTRDAYGDFPDPPAPLRQIGPKRWILDLAGGPTMAFKDFGLQLLARLFDRLQDRDDRRMQILGATSGDTGAAAVRAFAGSARCDVIMLHPKGRISDFQRRQMTTRAESNIYCVAVRGDFDDCQAMVKTLMAEQPEQYSAVNSINIARLLAQSVYYLTAAASLGATRRRPVAFVVPSGNFGNAYAGWLARRMGVGIAGLAVATNINDILARTLATGHHARARTEASVSPAMDIQAPSNFERLLFDVSGHDAAAVAAAMQTFRRRGDLVVPAGWLSRIRSVFSAARVDDDETKKTIRTVKEESDLLIDPHTAVAVAAADRCFPDFDGPIVCLATAHPAKFADVVRDATGIEPTLPETQRAVLSMPETMHEMEADSAALKRFAEDIRR